jgi:hypothetical protein
MREGGLGRLQKRMRRFGDTVGLSVLCSVAGFRKDAEC